MSEPSQTGFSAKALDFVAKHWLWLVAIFGVAAIIAAILLFRKVDRGEPEE